MKLKAAIFLLILFVAASPLSAHDPGLSSAAVRLAGERVNVLLSFNRSELQSLMPAINGTALGMMEVTLDGRPLAAQLEKVDVQDGIHIFLRYPSKPGSRLQLRSLLFEKLPSGHRQLLGVRGAGGDLLMERMLSARDRSVQISLDRTQWEAGFSARFASAASFARLGVEHIFTGYDHLLFLFGLLLVGGTLAAAARIITSFTLAHSLTLALATLDLVRVSSSIVEPLIAASILYIGCENLLGANLNGRWLLTFGFGLVHGFGFSSALRGMGIGSQGSDLLMPLLSFNLGVEIGQFAIAAPLLLVIWRLRRRAVFVRRWAPALSVLVTLAGGYWFVERTLLS